MKEDMRGLFYIVKGQYKKDNEELSVSGYDPCADETVEWYRLIDKNTKYCLCCGTDFKKVLRGVYTAIKKFKTAQRFYKFVSDTTSEDYYEVHYLGQAPLTTDQIAQKNVGRCPRVSPKMKVLEQKIYEYYGDFYEDYVEEMEDLAYQELKDNTPYKQARNIMKKTQKASSPKGGETLKKVNKESSEVKVKTPQVRKPKLRKLV